MSEQETVDVEYDEITYRTDNALLLSICDADVWIPCSQIHSHDAQERIIEIPEWLAIQKELV